jgi:homeobox-leucine zipper protein
MECFFGSLLSIAEETLAEFLCKATGTAVDWVQMIGMKPGPDSIGIVAVSRNCSGIAARACGLVSLEPMKVMVFSFYFNLVL